MFSLKRLYALKSTQCIDKSNFLVSRYYGFSVLKSTFITETIFTLSLTSCLEDSLTVLENSLTC